MFHVLSVLRFFSHHIVFFAFSILLLNACKPQIVRETEICYNLINSNALKLGDTLVIGNCSPSDFTWLVIVKDTNEFHSNFISHTSQKGHYWRLPLNDTGTFHCRIISGFQSAFAQIKTADFQIYVFPKVYD